MDLFSYSSNETSNKFRRSHPSRKSARRPRTPKLQLIDPLALWKSLPVDEAQRLGALTIALAVSSQGMNCQQEINPIYDAFEHVMHEASQQLGDFIAFYFPDALGSKSARGLPKLPNLNTLGIRQCTSCGCTDMSGCRAGCSWIGPARCSNCPSKKFASKFRFSAPNRRKGHSHG